MDRPEVPSRLLTPEEVNELLPQIRKALREIDRLRAQNRRVRGRLIDLDTQWGEEILRPDTPDHDTYEGLQEELDDAYKAIRKWVHGIHELGGHIKSLEEGLVDFHAERDGRMIFLCWQRGEPRLEWYHDLETGYAGREPLDGTKGA
ncbi:MAG: DUF2203 domain-containing protein [Candidatus Thermoplasmatota archaeon]|nr:DUF2203 domain-containing protein [Candidatus Thermoplasmatota archaeon]